MARSIAIGCACLGFFGVDSPPTRLLLTSLVALSMVGGRTRALRRLKVKGNPFEGKAFYVNPSYKTSLDTSIGTSSGDVKSTLESMREVPSAYWLDRYLGFLGQRFYRNRYVNITVLHILHIYLYI